MKHEEMGSLFLLYTYKYSLYRHKIVFHDKHTEDVCSFVDSETRKVGGALHFVDETPRHVSSFE